MSMVYQSGTNISLVRIANERASFKTAKENDFSG